MFDIHEVSAAPHLPEALKSQLPARPESLAALFNLASEDNSDIIVRMRDGEIFIAITAS